MDLQKIKDLLFEFENEIFEIASKIDESFPGNSTANNIYNHLLRAVEHLVDAQSDVVHLKYAKKDGS